MASRSNKNQREYGTPSYTPPSASSSQGRPQPRAGTNVRGAMQADDAARKKAASQAAMKKKKPAATPAPGPDPATSDLSVINAVSTIKKKQAKDKKAIDTMSQ
jgi:hypothetical protein